MCNSIFIPCSLIISFSSGIIILFLYCSLCSTYERKNNLKINTIISVTIIITLALHVPEEKYMYSLEKTINITRFSYSLIFVIFIVIISIKCINTSFFNPTKKIIQSYSWINKEIKNNPPPLLFFIITIFYLSSIFSTIGVLLGIAFFTLVERKIIRLIHYRKGPNKVLIMGLLQPITDATKLFTKENRKLQPLKIFIFVGAPLLGIFLIIICWLWYERVFSRINNKLKIFSILAIISLSVFVFLITRWGSNSKYSIIGGYRAIRQIISYEVCFIIFLFILFYLINSYSIIKLKLMQENIWFCFLSIPLFFCWMIICIAESNRTPFDLAEGESEIVSGFNIEYGGGLFALIFIIEYGIIMFLRFVSNLFFLGLSLSLLKTFLVCFMFIWVRCCFPRLRYDKLIHLCWKTYLPCSLRVLILSRTIFFL